MVKEILTATGIQFRRGRFTRPPAGNYATYTDDVTTSGPDGLPRIRRHDITVELYTPKPDDAAEAAIEAAIMAAGLYWTKQDRYWLQSEQWYQVIYEFSYNEKVRS
jgi:hypothetical protein